MNAPMEFPPLAEVPAAALAPLSIKETVLAQFRAEEPALIALADKYRNVAYDCKTPKGLQAAKDARHELRETGRYSLQRAEKKIKAEVNALKDVMAAEVERLIGIVKPVEDGIDAQIKAREAELEAERQAREQAEAARRAECEAGIAKIAGYVDQARGRTSAEIAQALHFVRESIVIEPEAWGDYTARAHATLNATLQALERMRDEASAEEARRAEAERLAAENARIAAELEAQRQALAAQQAEIDRQRAEIEARQRAEAEAEAERLRAAAAAAFADDEPDPIPAVTGTPEGHLLQDMSRGLSQALASKPDAMMHAREASAAIAAERLAEARAAEDAAAAKAFAALDEAERAGVDVPDSLKDAFGAVVAGMVIDRAAASAVDQTAVGTHYAPAELGESLGHAEAAEAGTEPTLSLTDLSDWFGLRLPAAFVADTLGILPRGESPRKTPLYAEADKAAIKAAMLVYVGGLPE